MSPTWTVRRQSSPRRDGDRRWDQAYQLLVRWAAAQTTTPGRWPSRRCLMRVALYARVSTPRQAQAQTIEQQLDRLDAAVTERGWTLDEGHVYRDDGYSGAEPQPPRPGPPARPRGPGRAGRGGRHRARPAGPQLRPPGAAPGGAGPARLPGRVPRPADEPGPPRPAAAADPRGGGRVRADADRRAHAPRPAGPAARRHAAALDHAAVRLPARPRPPPRPGRRAAGAGRGGAGGAALRLVPGAAGDAVPASPSG